MLGVTVIYHEKPGIGIAIVKMMIKNRKSNGNSNSNT